MNLPFTNEQLYPKQVTHRVGNVYDIGGYWYLLTQSDNWNLIVLAGLNNFSNRWENPVKVNDLFFITEDEFSRISNNTLNRVTYIGMIEDYI